MAIKKTAISIEKSLYEEIEALAAEMDVSRSRLFTMAVRHFLQQYKNRNLLEAINTVYRDLPDTGEEALLSQMKSKHSRLIKNQW